MTLPKEKLIEIIESMKSDLGQMHHNMEQQKLMGGIQPAHIIMTLEMKMNLVINVLFIILHSMVDEPIEEPSKILLNG